MICVQTMHVSSEMCMDVNMNSQKKGEQKMYFAVALLISPFVLMVNKTILDIIFPEKEIEIL